MFIYAQNRTHYQNCSVSFNCGNLTDIGYPFWGSNRPEYCGHPKFGLNCSEETADIKIEGLNYRVLEINSESTNLKVAREDYIGDICPTPHVSTTLDSEVMSYSSNIQDVTLYYGCPAPPFTLTTSQSISFSCNDGTRGFIATRDLRNLTLIDYTALCTTNVIVPASQSAIEAMETDLRVTEKSLLVALEEGFGVEWNANNSVCETCRISSGVCGYNLSTSAFACYCSNGQQQQFSCGGAATDQLGSGFFFVFLNFFSFVANATDVGKKTF